MISVWTVWVPSFLTELKSANPAQQKSSHHDSSWATRILTEKIERNPLTTAAIYATMINGTFYFWSLKSVQRRADKCCKSTHSSGLSPSARATKNKKYIQENVDAYN